MATMEPYFKASDPEVLGQYSPMVMFGATLVLGLGILAYVLVQTRKALKEG